MHMVGALLAGAVAGVLAIFTSWLVTGVLFHRYQRLTPGTWRPVEGPRQYALSSTLTVGAALAIALLFALTGGVHALGAAGWLANGLAFGSLCWAALALPVLLSMGVFVNLHRGMIVGLLLDWLLVSLLAGTATAWAVAR